MLCGPDGELPEKLRNLEPRLLEHVSNEIMDKDPNVRWNDIGNMLFLNLSTFTIFAQISEAVLIFTVAWQCFSWFGAC